MGDTVYSESYTYDADDGSLSSMTPAVGSAYTFTYDALKRLSVQSNDVITKTYSYRNISDTQTTTQVSSIAYTDAGYEFAIDYTYEELGNIKTVDSTVNTSLKEAYTYDEQGQLLTESGYSGNWTYSYDTYGNIRSATDGTTTHTYTYGDSNWLDLLTEYDGEEITYDAIGNPLSYYNGTRWTFSWQNGRQLAAASDGTTNISYTYDLAGIRDSKTVDGTIYNYITQDGLVVRQTWGSNVMDFIYDNNGRPYACIYNNATYYYVLNLQGDVIGLVDTTGAYAAKYSYDAWGALVSSSGTMASTNPLRYRGYYYDVDTGLYYLQTRYYDPVVKRFINADIPELAGADNTFIGLNLYAYCSNNPVMNIDEDGCLSNGWKIAITAGILVAATAVIVATGGIASGPVMCMAISAAQGAITGAVSGAVSGAAVGAVTSAVKHRATTGSWKGAGKAAASGAKQGAIDGAFSGAITGAISGAMHPTACFVAGTAIAVAAGYVAIETLKEGDLVWAWDEETGDVALKPVKQLFVNESDELIHLTINGETITTTPTHPFYVAHKGWYAAVDLRAGDILVLVNGEYVTLEKVQHEILEAPITVYNFEVEDYHTYYVGTDGVLVHNDCKQELVAGTKSSYNARVSVGGEARHPNSPHAHIFLKNKKIGSVDAGGNWLVGQIDRKARKFVKNNIDQIATGIKNGGIMERNLDINDYAQQLLYNKEFRIRAYCKSLRDSSSMNDLQGVLSASILKQLIHKAKYNRKMQSLLSELLDYIDPNSINDENFKLLLRFPSRMRNTYLSAIAHHELSFSQMLVLNRHPLSLEAFSFLFDCICRYACFTLEDLKTIIRENRDVPIRVLRNCMNCATNTYGKSFKIEYVEQFIQGAEDDILISVWYKKRNTD